MKAWAPILALTLILGVALSCKLSEKIVGDDNSVAVAELWPDVPPFPGATKVDQKLSVAARLFAKTLMGGKVAFISFHTDKTAQEVKDFYTGDVMKTAGWKQNQESCFRETEETKEMEAVGALCFFTKGTNEDEGLGVMVHDASPGVNIFYLRMNTAQK